MRLPLSKPEYKALEELAEKDGLTVDQATQVAVLFFVKTHDETLFAEARKHADSKVLQVLEER